MNHTPLNVAPDQAANLRKLAAALRKPLPIGLKFDMHDFTGSGDYDAANCGSVGCAVGLATHLVGPKLKRETYGAYGHRVFGVGIVTAGFDFLFDDGWTPRDNTPQGAAARIEYALKYGLPDCGDINDMQLGKIPLCYTEFLE